VITAKRARDRHQQSCVAIDQFFPRGLTIRKIMSAEKLRKL